MITILVDHNIEGNVVSLWGILAKDGWVDLIPDEVGHFRGCQSAI